MLQLSKNMSGEPLTLASPQIAGSVIQSWATAAVCLMLCLSLHAHAEESSRIVKWKDDKGVTHYGDKIPPQYADRENTLMNRQGITVQHNKPANYQEKVKDLAKLEQEKKDRVLLGAFTNADEIDLARDRNLQPDLIALDNLQQEKASKQKKSVEINGLADSYIKRKKPVPADVNADLKKNKAEIAKIDQLISDRQLSIENTRKRFDEDKKRYLLLKGNSNNALPETSAVP